ncbi:MAG: 50S ribosomal protein L24 [Lachnospiraceae bacterium]|nr:50S ribosomal protein L24 [Lachnospiraceae bacterium]
MSTMKIKVGDNVRFITGKDKGREGKVLHIDRKANRVVVEGINMLTKHNKQSAKNPNGGIIHTEGSIDISNVMLLKGDKTTRVGFEVRDGKKVRVAKIDGSVID